MAEQNKEFNALVRISQVDLDGNKPIYYALKKIKGVSFSFSNAVLIVSGVDKTKKTGYLTQQEIESIEKVIQNPLSHNIPEWMINRRSDFITGEKKHIIGGNITFVSQNDIRHLQKIKCWKGMRHMMGLPVRGQRTRANFRRGGAIGVSKAKIAVAAKKPDTSSKKADAKKADTKKK